MIHRRKRSLFVFYFFLLLWIQLNQILASESKEESKKISPWIITLATVGIEGGILTYAGISWYRETEFQKFNIRYTDFLGRNSYSGGADKLGHMWGSYWTTETLILTYKALGLSKKHSILLGFSAAYFMFTAIEVADGFTSFGFEWEDVLFNSFGSALSVLGQIYPGLHDHFRYRWGYSPSQNFLQGGTRSKFDIINDYSGMIFYFDHIPFWFPYIIVGLNWSSIGYSPAGPEQDRYLGVHFGINITRILKEFIPEKYGWLLSAISYIDKYFVLPFTLIEYRHGLNRGSSSSSIFGFGLSSYAQIKF